VSLRLCARFLWLIIGNIPLLREIESFEGQSLSAGNSQCVMVCETGVAAASFADQSEAVAKTTR
jgi:hypothetical protein